MYSKQKQKNKEGSKLWLIQQLHSMIILWKGCLLRCFCEWDSAVLHKSCSPLSLSPQGQQQKKKNIWKVKNSHSPRPAASSRLHDFTVKSRSEENIGREKIWDPHHHSNRKERLTFDLYSGAMFASRLTWEDFQRWCTDFEFQVFVVQLRATLIPLFWSTRWLKLCFSCTVDDHRNHLVAEVIIWNVFMENHWKFIWELQKQLLFPYDNSLMESRLPLYK